MANAKDRDERRASGTGALIPRSALIERMAREHPGLDRRDVELAVKVMLEQMTACLAGGGRIEIRGFGSFTLRFRPARTGRNPNTGTSVSLPARYAPHFKPGIGSQRPVDVVLFPALAG